MMNAKVWALEISYEYEGGTLVSVHATREGAQAAAQASSRQALNWQQRPREDSAGDEWWCAESPGRPICDIPGDATFEVSDYNVLT